MVEIAYDALTIGEFERFVESSVQKDEPFLAGDVSGRSPRACRRLHLRARICALASAEYQTTVGEFVQANVGNAYAMYR